MTVRKMMGKFYYQVTKYNAGNRAVIKTISIVSPGLRPLFLTFLNQNFYAYVIYTQACIYNLYLSYYSVPAIIKLNIQFQPKLKLRLINTRWQVPLGRIDSARTVQCV